MGSAAVNMVESAISYFPIGKVYYAHPLCQVHSNIYASRRVKIGGAGCKLPASPYSGRSLTETMRRTKHVIAVMVVATALCADRSAVAASPASVRPQT